jgi:hypothetical protein
MLTGKVECLPSKHEALSLKKKKKSLLVKVHFLSESNLKEKTVNLSTNQKNIIT